MTFPFLLCLNNGESGSGWEDVSLCKQCFFSLPIQRTAGFPPPPVFSNDTEPISGVKRRENNLIPNVELTAFSPESKALPVVASFCV